MTLRTSAVQYLIAHVLTIGLLASAATAAASTRRPGDVGPRSSGLRLSAGGFAVSEQLAGRSRHTCAVIADGTVRCWGLNNVGQLGDGSTTSSALPVTVRLENGNVLTNVVSVAAGRFHSCAVRADGTAFCWGGNSSGQLGSGSTSDSSTRAVQVRTAEGTAFDRVVMIVAAFGFTCALRSDGTVHCWGINSQSQLGSGTSTLQSAIPLIVGGDSPLSGVVSIAAGNFHACALRIDGIDSTVHCWGGNDNGQVGDGTGRNIRPLPVTVTLANGEVFTGVVTLAAGSEHSCALRTNGSVHCWGDNNRGELGNNTTTEAFNPVESIASGAVSIAAGASHSCAVLVDGRVRCWGLNDHGQLGNNQTGGTRLTPVTVTTSKLNDAIAVTAGGAHSCARRANDTVRCWGDNSAGQLGNSTNTADDEPVSVVAIDPAPSARGVAAGQFHTCALRASSEVACWGENGSGQLGNTNQTDQLSPVAVKDPVTPTQNFAGVLAITVGGSHTCALRFGAVFCWGNNTVNQLGNSTVGTFSPIPVQVENLTDAVAVSAGFFHSCAVRVGGTVRCWGRNNQGQLGDGSQINSPPTVNVERQDDGNNLSDVVAVAAGANQSCALQSSGNVFCWGSNSFGQLGDGTTNANSLRAVQVQSLSDATALASVSVANHHCAMRVDGSLRCWGRNFEAQLGDGTTTPRNVPVPANNIVGATALSAGSGHSCAAALLGLVGCWGINSQGQLGNGSTTTPNPPRHVIVAVGSFGDPPQRISLLGTVSLAGGAEYTCALIVNGVVACWGDNSRGQLGMGHTLDRLFATTVPSFAFNVAPAGLLGSENRVARVTALALCDPGDVVKIQITLTQSDMSGEGRATGRCTGALERYEVTVAAHGRDGFATGPATANAEAIVRRRGEVVSEPQWTRAVSLSPQ